MGGGGTELEASVSFSDRLLSLPFHRVFFPQVSHLLSPLPLIRILNKFASCTNGHLLLKWTVPLALKGSRLSAPLLGMAPERSVGGRGLAFGEGR